MDYDVFENFKQGLEMLKDAQKLMDKGPVTFYMEKLVGAYEYMIERFCPFKKGDRIELAVTPKITSDSGWYGCRHFLIEGAKGTIYSTECGKNGFSFLVQFDDESYIDCKGVITPIEDKHVFYVSEESLRKVGRVD
jgi:hypothetical protein